MRIDNTLNTIKLIKNPSKITLAITKRPDDDSSKAFLRYNIITLEWFMRTSISPVMFAISIGHTRYSYECLQMNRYFNLVYPSKEMVEIAKYCGSHSGRDLDKFKELDLKFINGKLAGYPILKDSVAVLECETVSQVKSGDHTIFVGEVKHCWTDSSKEILTYYHF